MHRNIKNDMPFGAIFQLTAAWYFRWQKPLWEPASKHLLRLEKDQYQILRTHVQALLVGEILMGISLSIYQTLTITSALEVLWKYCPVALHTYLTTYMSLCWVFG